MLDHSPRSKVYLVTDDGLALPTHVLESLDAHKRFLWWALLFLNASCLWAYYTCLSAQNYYQSRFASTSFNFAYLTTPVSTWPMFAGHLVQILFGLDKKLGLWRRVCLGYSLYALCAIAILLQDILDASPNTGAIVVLVAFGVVGLTNSLAEAALYGLSALFPDATLTNAVQLGNGTSGFLNVTISTLIQLCVGGWHPLASETASIQKVSFYIFFSILIVVCGVAVGVFRKVLSLPCVMYLMAANDDATSAREAEPLRVMWGRLGRIAVVVAVPFACQFVIFLCSLTAFPGIGISSGFQLAGAATWGGWYVNGVLLSYNYGDFFGRLLAPSLYKYLTLRTCLAWSIGRWGLFVCLLLGLPGGGQNPLFCMGAAHAFNIFWQLFINFALGMTTGILSTITIGLGPRLVAQEDRESAGAILVLGLFLGISSGATLGWQFGQNHWLGA
ncbi:hypothetical protein SPRG_10452 [Saprolegnia parasitica CBS 223.65]|uniref:Major facilitator superfamily (MFS) profile domain-containing protein n=1 Tax=Saprolegnia parasitica (strain CBS 223.65) TaxID=695850 RepID=A0A067C0Q9_SAPPC|nr:hypothetical protein SPRG_10452 [Saprolegnia parasitica CBS 223.65]KDO24374.1 hypothetical protein SPRG_10452 [Saprolegnia parasitica CBS 223.65]|eukprot:XP_012204967.1 hypothetical protein SPRG_10452 [Saprolegnia parasitica CBS 223.65]